MKLFRPVALLLALLLLAGCAASAPQGIPASTTGVAPDGRAEFDTFLAQLSAARRESPDWTPEELAAFQAVAPGSDDLLTEEEVAALMAAVRNPPVIYQGVVSAEAARSDIELFFRALKSSYGAYEYFGGDAVFLPLRDSLLHELSQQAEWRPRDVAERLTARLSPVIQDGHFRVNRAKVLARQQAMFTVPDLYFERDAAQPSEYVRPTIGPDGRLTYCFAALTATGGALPVKGSVGGKEVALKWERAADLGEQGSPVYAERQGGTPGFVCRSLNAVDEAALATLEQMAADGARWRQEPVLAIDLRGNSGGNSRFGTAWTSSFLGAPLSLKRIGFLKPSRLWQLHFESLLGATGESGFDSESQPDAARSSSTGVVFVMQDANTASAGESFVFALHSLENALFVGSSTQGVTMMGSVMVVGLPRTGINVQFGAGLSLVGTTENIEGRGHLPDLWVPPAEAEAAIARMVDYYGLR